MKFISVDLELNQPSDKILQIGAAQFCTDLGGIEHRLCIYVDPGEIINYDHMLNIGQTLGQLLPEDFAESWAGCNYRTPEALTMFWEWVKIIGSGKKFIQWGRGDMECLVRESREANVRYPNHTRTLDLKQVYQFFWQSSARLAKNSGLGTACNQMNVLSPCPAHDALADAEATGRLFLEMYKRTESIGLILQRHP